MYGCAMQCDRQIHFPIWEYTFSTPVKFKPLHRWIKKFLGLIKSAANPNVPIFVEIVIYGLLGTQVKYTLLELLYQKWHIKIANNNVKKLTSSKLVLRTTKSYFKTANMNSVSTRNITAWR
jgi:hypothetical protein